MKKIKKYSEVKVGDIAFNSPDAGGEWNREIGEVVWIGSYDKLLQSKFHTTLGDWEGMDEDGIREYDLIVVIDEMYGPTLFNYNNDPSGVVVFE